MTSRAARASDPAWLRAAFADLGLKELPGPRHSARVIEMFRLSGHPEIKNDETAWCAAAVGAWLREGGQRGTQSLAARSYLNWGRTIGTSEEIPRGAVLIFRRGTSEWQGHVCLCLEDDGGTLTVIGGNQSDAVTITTYSRSGLLGARWPTQAAAQPKPAPVPAGRQTGITATIFADPQVAYSDVAPGWNNRPGVALPFRFHGTRPKVRVYYGGKSVVCEIMDVGPIYPHADRGPADPYWSTGTRPRAETFNVLSGAGIDLTPGAARALGLPTMWKGKVDWEFVAAQPKRPVEPPVAGPQPPDVEPTEPEPKSPAQSSTIWAKIAEWLSVGGASVGGILGMIDWRVAIAVVVVVGIVATVWIIRERLKQPDVRNDNLLSKVMRVRE